MGGLLSRLASRYDLTADKKQAWGSVDGYWFQVGLPSFGGDCLSIRTSVRFPNDAALKAAANELAHVLSRDRTITYERVDGTLLFNMRHFLGLFKYREIETLITTLLSLFKKYGAREACYHCRDDHPGGFVFVNGTAAKLCSNCRAEVNKWSEEQALRLRAERKKQLRAYIGAAAGAVVASVLWIPIGRFNLVETLFGIAVIFCAAAGFRIMKGRFTLKAWAAIFLICVAAMALAQFAFIDIEYCKDLINQNIQFNYGKVILETFLIPFKYHFHSDFICYLVLRAACAALGCLWLIRAFRVQPKMKTGKT